MKFEFYALIVFFTTLVIFLVTTHIETRPRVEEVLPSPLVFTSNPFSEHVFTMVNQMNKQLLLLEYNIRTPAEFRDVRELEDLYNVIDDPRAAKNLSKRILVTWWGNALVGACFSVKHITVCWRPTVEITTETNGTSDFGSALLSALSGTSERCRIGNWDVEIAKLIAERYAVLLRMKH
ncbi:hypothetical protein [Fervidobacterium thailandense]|uniref:Uncharacterized protein n=1 Tax=Fervidobacterium thailandense TaxID=1008305 RepID=A0A1E3G494_9BACT|nr:hypothetical protein [Fervidobacterium thailandense]ODN31096.1 hypothetical protein A4H02_02165 [Fervidobacterium thailandense]